MNCLYCAREFESASRVCPYCGQYNGEEAPAVIPVGEAVPVYAEGDGPGARLRATGVRPSTGKRRRRTKKKKGRDAYRRVMINWAAMALTIALLLFAAVLGSYVYLKVTPGGQLVLARMGRDANADAYWALGMEYLDQGYIPRSIETYEHALELEPEHPQLVDKLMMLAEAYEAGGLPHKAEEVYTRIYEKLAPEDAIGYRNVIRLMMQQERITEAVELMGIAAEKTGDESFSRQRASHVPLPPTAKESSGRHLKSVEVAFYSPQGYEIYYTTGDEQLPDGGTRYEGPFVVGEGTHSFRAVCVASKLWSDEMTVKYIVTLPQPPAPKTNLAPGTYSGSRSVRLRDMETDKQDKRKESQLYYTIDGTPPTADSPRYTGEPIKLPGGRVTLRAIAINGYGKISNELNVGYTINNVPRKKYFNGTDEFKGLTLLKTTYEDFVKRYGEPQQLNTIEDDAIAGVISQAVYAWGEARFCLLDIGNMLYHLSTNDPSMVGPRNTRAGTDMVEVTQAFRDMGQLPNERGDRGIYYDIADGYANYRVESDDPTSGTLRYVATLFDETASTRLLTYDIRAGKVARVELRYVDRKISIVN